MESSGKKLWQPSEMPVEMQDARSPEFPAGISLVPEPLSSVPGPAQLPVQDVDMWHDVFVRQELPWPRFLQSGLLHGMAVYLICTITLSWMQGQKILTPPAFDRSSLVTYTPEEYLPPLDTGKSEAPRPEAVKTQKADPVYAKQPILSVPPEADNHSQTIVVPPDLKLNHDVPVPNIVATGEIAPADSARCCARQVKPPRRARSGAASCRARARRSLRAES